MVIRFLAITQPFLTNRTEIFCGKSGNYYLLIISLKSMLWHLISDFIFSGHFCGEMGVAATPAPKGLGPQNPTIKLAHGLVLLGHL